MAPIDRDTVSDRRARTAPPPPGLEDRIRRRTDSSVHAPSSRPSPRGCDQDRTCVGVRGQRLAGVVERVELEASVVENLAVLELDRDLRRHRRSIVSTSETMLRRRPNSTGCTPKSTSECQFLLSRSQHPRSPSQRNIADRPRADSPSCVPVPAIRGSLEGPESLTIWDLRVAARPIRIARSRCGIRSRRG